MKSGEILKYTCVLDGSVIIGLLVLKRRNAKHRKIWTICKVKVKEKHYYSFFWGSHYVYVGTPDGFQKVSEVLFIFLYFFFFLLLRLDNSYWLILKFTYSFFCQFNLLLSPSNKYSFQLLYFFASTEFLFSKIYFRL